MQFKSDRHILADLKLAYPIPPKTQNPIVEAFLELDGGIIGVVGNQATRFPTDHQSPHQRFTMVHEIGVSSTTDHRHLISEFE